MQVNSLMGMPDLNSRATYKAAQEEASAASFAQTLEDVKRRVAKNATPTIIDSAKISRTQAQRMGLKEGEGVNKDLLAACQGFEAMFLDMMYKQMRQTVPENTLFGESNGQKIFTSMRDSEMMKEISKAGGIGLADLLYRQLADQVNAQQAALEQSGNGKMKHTG